jgi:hypothetical protein
VRKKLVKYLYIRKQILHKENIVWNKNVRKWFRFILMFRPKYLIYIPLAIVFLTLVWLLFPYITGLYLENLEKCNRFVDVCINYRRKTSLWLVTILYYKICKLSICFIVSTCIAYLKGRWLWNSLEYKQYNSLSMLINVYS